MEILSTLIAAQQAALSAPRQAAAATPAPGASSASAFSQVLEKGGEKAGFEPLPLKQTAPQAPAQARSPAARPGAQVDIRV